MTQHLPQRRRVRAGGRRAALQRGMTLIDFMVGITVGLLVVLAAVGSMVVIRGSARTLNDSAALEQQATLIMSQIGQQISQAGAINAYLGTNPNAGIPGFGVAAGGGNGKINFDTRPIGVPTLDPKNIPPTGVSIFGTDGDNNQPDTLIISYAAPNDGAPDNNCIGNQVIQPTDNSVPHVISVFQIRANANNSRDPSDLICGDGTNPSQPIASDVVDFQVRYLTVNNNGNVTYQNAAAATPWNTISGIEVCLQLQGDVTQAPSQTFNAGQGCWNAGAITFNNGRVQHFAKQTFYLRNSN